FSEVTPTGYSPTSMAHDLRGLLDVLGIERPSVVGHSYGADIALYFALHHPHRVRRVMAIEAALPVMMSDLAHGTCRGWSYREVHRSPGELGRLDVLGLRPGAGRPSGGGGAEVRCRIRDPPEPEGPQEMGPAQRPAAQRRAVPAPPGAHHDRRRCAGGRGPNAR